MTQLPPSHRENQTFKSVDLSQQSLTGQSFTSCSWENCNLSESIWQNAKWIGCTFKRCNLSLVKLEGARLQDVQFIDCKIVGAEFFKCEKTFFSPHFENCLLHYCNFSDLKMKNGSFYQCKIRECHFTQTVLTGANFKGADLEGTLFHNCDLSQADFSTAINYSIDPQTNKLKKAKFSLPEAAALLRGFDIVII